jgi:hypothetical protein
MANSNFHRNANANANSNADTNANSNANSNTLTGLNANALRNLESQINSRMRSEEPAHASEECNSHTEANCNSSQDPRFQSPKGETRFAAAYRMSVREMAVERELRVGAGPVCGPGRIRPEVLERIRLREEKWARERAAAGGRAP